MITTAYENNALTIKLDSAINNINADAVKEEIAQLVNRYKADEVIFDAQDLSYISSAGLRIFWQFFQQNAIHFCICNVLPQVYDLFVITRFNEIIDVRCAG